MDIEKFKLELFLKGYELEYNKCGTKFYARIVNAEYPARIPSALKTTDDRWKYFSWGVSENDAIIDVYEQWITRKNA